jgi:tRNA nucleotidyltransferase/poly(A) polymerase
MTQISACANIRNNIQCWVGYSVLTEVLNVFEDIQIYVAGGVVRNAFAGNDLPVKDFDLFFQGKSTGRAIEYFGKVGHLDVTPYGSPRWMPFCYKECYADLIPVTDFSPGLWKCEDIIDVLNQFDFTANAIAYDLRYGEIFDPQNGVRDAMKRIMKMVRFDYPKGPYVPSANLDRNAVLWFRVVHYASKLKFRFDSLTENWLKENCKYKVHTEEFTSLFFRPDLRSFEELDV